jgi:hypothetical protein
VRRLRDALLKQRATLFAAHVVVRVCLHGGRFPVWLQSCSHSAVCAWWADLASSRRD